MHRFAWPVRPALWARWAPCVLGLAALASLYAAVAWWAAVVALPAGWLASRHFDSGRTAGVLRADGWQGAWQFEYNGQYQQLALEHVWHGPVWTTLRFLRGGSGRRLHLTIWRHEVSSLQWRLLRQVASRGVRPLSQEAS